MKELIQVKLGLPFMPTLQYSNTPKRLAPVPVKPVNSDLVLWTRFSLLNTNISKNHALPVGSKPGYFMKML
jgi:hypothetical protein